jgi:hypothetical protein
MFRIALPWNAHADPPPIGANPRGQPNPHPEIA